MVNLILTILFTSWLLLSFRVFSIFKINHLQAIIFNYIVCAVMGFFFYDNYKLISEIDRIEPWMIMAMLTGALFLPTFYLMSYTVKKVSVTVSTIAAKTSLIIPVSASILFLNKDLSFTVLNFAGLILGLTAILLSSIKSKNEEIQKSDKSVFLFLLPALVFIGGGLVDVMINITNYSFLPENKSSLFPFFAFSVAALSGLIVLIWRIFKHNEKINYKNSIGGIVLGIPNYLSIFFLLKALQNFNNNGAIVFPALNIAVILINATVAIFLFKEKLNKYNLIGLVLAIISLVFIITP